MQTSAPLNTESKANTQADFKAILKQVDLIFEKKYDMVTITLAGTLSPEQFATLDAKIQTMEKAWQSAINFKEFKEDYLKDNNEDVSDYQIEKEFDELKTRGRQWNLNIENTVDNQALVDFVVTQLQAKRIWSLKLNLLFSEKSFDRIIYACKHAVGFIEFGCKEQIVTDKQGKILAECMLSGSLQYIVGLSGKNFSQETAEQFVAATRKKHSIDISDCPHFKERQSIEWTIDLVNTRPIFGLHKYAFRSDDIVRLTEKLIDSPHPIQFHLSAGTYADPQWITFFTKVLSSKTPVTELTISSSEIEINNEIMLAIATSLGLNTTIKSLAIYKALNHDVVDALVSSFKINKTLAHVELRTIGSKVTKIVESLASHPALVSLMLNGSICSEQRKAFQQLLSQTKVLQKLYLVTTLSDDNTITEIADGLENNNTLQELYLTDNIFTDTGLIRLSDIIPKNEKLTRIYLNHHYGSNCSLDGVNYFLRQLQCNKTLVDVQLPYPAVDDKKIEPIQASLQEILERNKKLSQHRRFEWELEHKQPYVETAILLFQAHRQNVGWKAMVILEKTLAFLAPHSSIVQPAQTQRCTDLIRNNILNRKWNSTLEAKISHYGYQETRMFTVFKKWPGRTETFGKTKVVSRKKNGNSL